MADMSKAEKLAAARRKLREFQHNKESPATSAIKQSYSPEKSRSQAQTPSDTITNKNGIESWSHSQPAESTFQQQDQSLNSKNNNGDSLSCNISERENAKESSSNIPSSFFNQDYKSPVSNNQQIEEKIFSSTPMYAVNPSNLEVTNKSEDVVCSTSETLRQLAMQMNGLIGQELDNTGSPTIIADESFCLGASNDQSELLSRNQQLAGQLAERDQTIAHLHASLSQLEAKVSGRDEELHQTLAEAEQKWAAEFSALREQLQLHTQTVGILVAEKTEAQAALSKAQVAAKTKAAEAEEAQGRLRASRQKLTELESHLAAMRSGQEQGDERLRSVNVEVGRLKDQLRAALEHCDESKEEASQLQQRLHASAQQLSDLQTDLHEKNSQLSIAQVRLQQLGGSVPGGVEVTEAHTELQAEHERRVSLEREVAELRSAATEREQTSQQYQQFIEQLNAQLTLLAGKLQESSLENEKLNERQQSLTRHIGELETRLQRVPIPKAGPSAEEVAEQENLKQELAALQDFKQSLEDKLKSQEEEITLLKLQLAKAEERVAELQEGRPDEARLLAAMESDKVAAARATAQNTQLKQQLLEQQHVHAQLVDQLRHFEARAQHAETLQQDLLKTQEEVKNLTNENACLKDGILKTTKEATVEQPDSQEGVLPPEAAARLQDRFAHTMRQLAEISDEKQKLEHLVMQLQGETETIGEYVALYQQQRGLLQQRAAEKDKEMERMAAEREGMRHKLKRVGQLVSDLVLNAPNSDRESKDLKDCDESKLVTGDVAEQISALLNEIGDSDALAEPVLKPEYVHHSEAHHPTDTMLPCPLCSGRLEVV